MERCESGGDRRIVGCIAGFGVYSPQTPPTGQERRFSGFLLRENRPITDLFKS
jgi:hypothetical protein